MADAEAHAPDVAGADAIEPSSSGAPEAALPGSAPGDRAAGLHAPDLLTVWTVRRGFVDLFAQVVEPDTGQPGRRYHIVRIEAGQAIVSVWDAAAPTVRFSAAPSLDLEADTCRLRDALGCPDRTSDVAGWIRRIATLCAEPPATESRTVAPGSATLIDAIVRAHAAFADAVSDRLIEAVARERAALARRRRIDAQQMNEGLARLGAALDGRAAAASTGAATADPCGRALTQVLRILGRPPRSFPASPLGFQASIDRTERLAATARLRGRRVLLAGRWWRQDRGVLVAFRVDEAQTPVVLRPRGTSGYDLLEANGTIVRVSARIADELRVEAFQFYKAFGPGSVGLRQILHVAGRPTLVNAATVVALSLLTGGLALAPPLAIAFLFNTVLPQADLGLLGQVAIGIGVVALGSSLFELTKAIALVRLETAMSLTFEAALVDRVLDLPVRFFAGFTSGDLVDRVLAMSEIRRTIAGQGVLLLLELVFSGFSIVFLFAIEPRLAAVASAFLLLAFGMAVILNALALRHETAAVVDHGRLDGLTVQLVLGIAKLRVAAAETRAMNAWTRLFAARQDRLRAHQSYRVALQVLAALLPPAGLALLFDGATAFSGTPTLPAGSFMAFNAAFGALLGVVMAVSTELTGLLRCVPLFRQARPLLTAPTEPVPAASQDAPLTGRIEIHNLRFRYRDEGPPALDGLTLTVGRGEFLAIVGPSGSGKSTLIRLLLGFERPQGGAILFDGAPQDRLDPALLRRSMGTVLQQSRIGPGNIYANIVGSSGLGLDEAWDAARRAGLATDIEQLPMGMHTTMLEGGQGLSGGQRQRLLIARALVHKPKILLFDEATSALDNRTQGIVMRTVAGLPVTRIVIAHRLSTIRQADRICVLEAGRLVQSGSYAALAACEGPFRTLIERQTAD